MQSCLLINENHLESIKRQSKYLIHCILCTMPSSSVSFRAMCGSCYWMFQLHAKTCAGKEGHALPCGVCQWCWCERAMYYRVVCVSGAGVRGPCVTVSCVSVVLV
eukprot:TRINITY_DN35768_c1_g2_i7.p1 TRINITY_DN35768_c1_g2~~TRINITY_DN35768_c1_g2_i7.p1  ORF type:complete len:105 (+),score=5.33 TRINITY_DN35768_c1_g2_i7:113-427(+)